MMRNYDELLMQCKELGLTWKETRRKSKRPLIEALQKHFIKENDVEMTPGLAFRLNMESPMLAKLITGLKNNEIDEIYSNKMWVFDTKHNGLRMTVHNNYGNFFEVFSRNESVTDFLPVPYGKKIYWGEDPVYPEEQFTLDCEVVSSNPNILTKLGGMSTETELQAIAALLALNIEESLAIQKELTNTCGPSPRARSSF